MINIHEEVANAILAGGDWWFNFEWFEEGYSDSWYTCLSNRVLFEALSNPKYTLRKKKRYININGTQVPEPVRDPLDRNESYYLVDISDDNMDIYTWYNTALEHIWLERGLIHRNLEDAQTHIRALIKANNSN